MRIYFDNAATTPISDHVFQGMVPYLKGNYGNPSSTHQEGRTARAAIECARRQVAKSIGASNAEIVFTSGGTEANNMAIKCAVWDLGVTRIISSPIEHSCVYNATKRFQSDKEIEICYVNIDSSGRADLNHLEQLLGNDDQPTLVTLMHGNNEIGTLNDIEKIGTLCKTYGAYFHTDTVQTIGHIPIMVDSFYVTFLSGSGHKLHGPKGVGFLYINKDIQINPLIDGGGQERKMRSGTENVASVVGIGLALEDAIKHIDERKDQILALRQYFMDQLRASKKLDVIFNGDAEGTYLFTVLSVGFKTNCDVGMLLFKLDLKGISASGGSACNSGAVGQSRVLGHIGVEDQYQSVRFSFSHFNTKTEVDQVIETLHQIL